MSKPEPTTPDDGHLKGFDTYDTEFVFEPMVGLTIHAHKAAPWLSWDDTKALAAWLAEVVEQAELEADHSSTELPTIGEVRGILREPFNE